MLSSARPGHSLVLRSTLQISNLHLLFQFDTPTLNVNVTLKPARRTGLANDLLRSISAINSILTF